MENNTQAFQENPEIYTFENTYLSQEANNARYYIDGKGICVTRSGNLLWYEMPPEDKGCFLFDENVLNEHLQEDFTEKEQQAITFIRDLDRQAQEYLLHVVSTVNNGENQYIVFYSPASEAYFQVDLDDIPYVSLITANLMAQYAEPSSLQEPCKVKVLENGVIQ